MKFLIITSKDKMLPNMNNILELLSKMIEIFEYELVDDNNLIVYFYKEYEFEFSEVILNINQDFYNDFRGYISRECDSSIKRVSRRVLEGIKSIPIDDKHIYLDDKTILKFIVTNNLVTEDIKKGVLKKYYNDFEMIKTIKGYLENNQNTSLAAKKLFVHRNTLISRIERFNDETKLDVRTFFDGYLVYHLL